MKHFVLVMLICLISCNSKDYNKIISDADSIVNRNTDSAIYLLQKIHNPEKLTDKQKADFWLVTGQAHYNLRKSMAEDSALYYSLNYYSNRDTGKLIQAHVLYAQHLWWKKDKKGAMDLLHKGLGIARAANDTSGMAFLLKSMIITSEYDNRFTDVINFSRELIKLGHTSGMWYNTIGIAYYYLGQKDSSLINLEKSINHIITNRSDSISAWDYAMRNYADILSEFGENRKAVDIQKKILNHYLQTNHKFTSLSYMSLARCYLNMNNTDSARYYMQKAEEAKQPNIDEDLSLGNYYNIQKAIMNFATNNTFLIRDIVLFSNNMFDKFTVDQKIISGKQEAQQLLEKRNLNLSIEKQRSHMYLIIAIFALILITCFTLYYIQRKKRLIDEKEEELDTLKHMLSDVNKNINKDDTFFKKILLQQLGIIRLVATNPSSHNQELLLQMARITNKDIPVEDLLVWDDLYKVIDSVYENFYTKTAAVFGDTLNEKEIQLCCLLRADFSTKEISVIIQQSVRTIYQRKTTIRQKLGMDEKEDIVEFICYR